MKFHPTPTPPELFRQFERGDLSREELQAAMAIHQRGLIDEMEDARRDPISAYLEGLRNRAMAKRWVRKIGASRLREILSALGNLSDFPPAQLLWNAGHLEVPLHCYFRAKKEPVFLLLKVDETSSAVAVEVEYGQVTGEKIVREKIILRRGLRMQLELQERLVVS